MHSRFLDLSLELSELGDRQLAVLVVVEALDEVQSALLGVAEFSSEDADRLVEPDEVAARLLVAATAHATIVHYRPIGVHLQSGPKK